jgi:hypothetical protein
MHDVNWWLMVLAFVLGLVLTLVFMVRRVTREVPVTLAHTVRGGAGLKGPDVEVRGPDVDVRRPDVDVRGSGHGLDAGAAVAGVAAAGGAAAAKFAGGESASESETAKFAVVGDDEPYGAGSARAGTGGSGPAGWPIKGNEDSMLYHTLDSPSYDQTIAEIWFSDEVSAERAGFTRWDKGRAAAGAATFADVPPGPYGVGSAKPNADGSGPSGWTIKGNEDSMLYHTPDSPSYKQTIAEVWFFEEATAEQAGFTPWHKGRKK